MHLNLTGEEFEIFLICLKINDSHLCDKICFFQQLIMVSEGLNLFQLVQFPHLLALYNLNDII